MSFNYGDYFRILDIDSCQDDMEEIWEAINDIVLDDKHAGHHGHQWQSTFRDDGSIIAHFFAAASWAGPGKTVQDLYEWGGVKGWRSPNLGPGDTIRDMPNIKSANHMVMTRFK